MRHGDTHAALQRSFGLSSFRPGQQESVEALLSGRDVLAVLPTGGGKSLIYQLAGVLLPGVTLVISPLIALMHDQVESLRRRRIPAACVNSNRDASANRAALASVVGGRTKILYVAPERLRNADFLRAMKSVEVSLLSVDEAHCISVWGHDFRPDYRRLPAARELFPGAVVCAVTATATRAVQDDVVGLLGMAEALRVVKGFNRPNLFLEVRQAADKENKDSRLITLLGRHKGPGIIYVGTRGDAERVADEVRARLGIPIAAYHGQMASEERTKVQSAFMKGELDFVSATNAFGMGIDRSDVRLIVHYSIPGTIEAYYQEAGRAGRDGLPAQATLIHCPEDADLQDYFIRKCAPSHDQLQVILDELRANPRIEAQDLMDRSDCDLNQVRVAVARMEEEGLLLRDSRNPQHFMHIEPKTQCQKALERVSDFFVHWQALRRLQFKQMTAYATSRTCRRRFILEHFGDQDDPRIEPCCDVCKKTGPRARALLTSDKRRTREERAAIFILGLVRKRRFTSVTSLVRHLEDATSRAVTLSGAKEQYRVYVVIPYGRERRMATELAHKGLIKYDLVRQRLIVTPEGAKLLDEASGE